MTEQRAHRDGPAAGQGVALRRARVAPAAQRRRIGVVVGTLMGTSALIALLWPGHEQWSARGPMNAGHERLACESCHRQAAGTLRQQLQANVRFALGMRRSAVDFGERTVENEDCASCHDRPFDRHPVSRFTEPRFTDVRKTLTVQRCDGCHREHSGARVTVAVDYCAKCHGNLELKSDPLDTTHVMLAREMRFSTCLGCHDFHGNHVMTPPTRLNEATPVAQVKDYFRGGASPYPSHLRRQAKQERD